MMLERREQKNPERRCCHEIHEAEKKLNVDRQSKKVKSKLLDYRHFIHVLSDTIFAIVESRRTFVKSALLLSILFFVANIGLARAQLSDAIIDSVENLPTSKRIQFYNQELAKAQSIDESNQEMTNTEESLFSESNLELNQLYEQLLLAQTKNDSLFVAEILHRISIDYSSSGRWERGELLAHDAVDIARDIEVDSTLASSLNALAISLNSKAMNLYELGELDDNQFLQLADSVITIYDQKLEVLARLDLPRYEAYTYQGMGQLYLQTEKLRPEDSQKALENLEIGRAIALTTNDQLLQFTSQLWYASSLLHQKKFNEILFTLDELEPMLDNYSLNSLAKYMYYHLRLTTELYLAGRDDLVIVSQQEENFLQEKWMIDHQVEIASMDRRYETSKTKRELDQQSKINDLQQAQIYRRNFIIGIIFILLLGITCGFYYFSQLNRKNQKLAENNAMLVKEQNHRVKNNLQMISSLLSLQADRADDSSKETMLISSRRVQAIALLHRRLYDDLDGVKEVEIKTYIEELIQDILFATGKQDVPLRLNLENVSLPVEKAVHLALILNELITNSLKHVFSRARLNGECIELSLAKPDGQIELTYRDNGGSFDVEAFKTSDSLGNQIILSQAAHLAQEFEVADEDGMKFEMKFAT